MILKESTKIEGVQLAERITRMVFPLSDTVCMKQQNKDTLFTLVP